MDILIVEDHKIVSDRLEQILLRLVPNARLQVARTLTETLRLVRNDGPKDLALLDLHLPDAQGLAAVRRLGEHLPLERVVVFSGNDQPAYIESAALLGLRGFISKGTIEVEPLLARVIAGEREFPGGVPRQNGVPRFTPKQYEVLSCLAQKITRTNAEIGALLGIHPRSVKNHVLEVCARLNVRTREEAVERARLLGLV